VIGNTGPTWFNMTDWTTGGRATLKGQNHPPAPNTPGPDDDFRLTFNGGVDWTDVQVIDTDVSVDGVDPSYFGPQTPVVYAALGNPDGNIQITPGGTFSGNAVYRTENPLTSPPDWYTGEHGVFQNEIQEITFTNDPTAGVYTIGWQGNSTANLAGYTAYQPDVNQLGVPSGLGAALNVIIPGGNYVANSVNFDVNSATIDVTFVGALGNSPQPLIQILKPNGLNIKVTEKQAGGGFDSESAGAFNTLPNDTSMGNIKLAVLPPSGSDFPILANVTVYASVTNFTNQSALGVFKSTSNHYNPANLPPAPPAGIGGG
jgi:hypothetical protein